MGYDAKSFFTPLSPPRILSFSRSHSDTIFISPILPFPTPRLYLSLPLSLILLRFLFSSSNSCDIFIKFLPYLQCLLDPFYRI